MRKLIIAGVAAVLALTSVVVPTAAGAATVAVSKDWNGN